MKLVLIFCYAFRCNISHLFRNCIFICTMALMSTWVLTKVSYAFYRWLCSITVQYFRCIWSFVVAINKKIANVFQRISETCVLFKRLVHYYTRRFSTNHAAFWPFRSFHGPVICPCLQSSWRAVCFSEWLIRNKK